MPTFHTSFLPFLRWQMTETILWLNCLWSFHSVLSKRYQSHIPWQQSMTRKSSPLKTYVEECSHQHCTQMFFWSHGRLFQNYIPCICYCGSSSTSLPLQEGSRGREGAECHSTRSAWWEDTCPCPQVGARRDFFQRLSSLCVPHFVQFLNSFKKCPQR